MFKKSLIASFAFAMALTASASVTVAEMGTRTLRVGSRGSDVAAVQKALNECNGSSLVTDGIFGRLTAAQFSAFQTAKGIKVDGIVGPQTKATLAACATSTSTGSIGSTGSTTMSGTEGNLTNIVKLGAYNSTKVMEGDKDKVVYGFEFTVKDGEQKIDGLQVSFQNTPAGASNTKFIRYASDVSVWLNGKELARKAASAFSDDANDVYVYRFTGMSGMVAKDQKAQILIAVSANSSIDSTDASAEAWKVNVGTTVSGTSNFVSAVSANGRFRDFGSALGQSTMDFQKAGTASSDQKFKVTTAASNPVAQTVQVSNTSDTNEVLLAAFDVKAENAAMKVQKIPATLTITGTDATVSNTAVAKTLKLYANGTLLATETVTASAATSEVITFGNTSKLNYAIANNATVKFEIKADINDIEETAVASTDFDNGDKAKVSVDSATMTVELDNAMGDTVSNKTGSVTGDNMTFRAEGVQVTMGAVTSTATTNTDGQIATRTYSIPVSVKAFDNTVYLAQAAGMAATTTTAQSIAYQVENSTGAVAALTANATFTSSDAPVQGSAFRVDSGATRNFTLTVVVSGTAVATQSQYRVQLEEVRTFVDSALTAGTSTAQTLTPANTYETTYQPINL